jgi:hypothetical protein
MPWQASDVKSADFEEAVLHFRAEVESPFRKNPYVRQPFPTDLDEAIMDLVGRFVDADHRERLQLWVMLQPSLEHSQVLVAYSERMATQALRQSDVELVREGLVAVLLEGGRDDWRETTIALTLLYDAATRLGASGADVFGQVAKLAPKLEVSQSIRKFSQRSPENRTIESMGYQLTMSGHGVTYAPNPEVWEA